MKRFSACSLFITAVTASSHLAWATDLPIVRTDSMNGATISAATDCPIHYEPGGLGMPMDFHDYQGSGDQGQMEAIGAPQSSTASPNSYADIGLDGSADIYTAPFSTTYVPEQNSAMAVTGEANMAGSDTCMLVADPANAYTQADYEIESDPVDPSLDQGTMEILLAIDVVGDPMVTTSASASCLGSTATVSVSPAGKITVDASMQNLDGTVTHTYDTYDGTSFSGTFTGAATVYAGESFTMKTGASTKVRSSVLYSGYFHCLATASAHADRHVVDAY